MKRIPNRILVLCTSPVNEIMIWARQNDARIEIASENYSKGYNFRFSYWYLYDEKSLSSFLLQLDGEIIDDDISDDE